MKRLVAYSVVAVVLISLLSVAAYAEDVVVELSSNDGSSGLAIKNAAGVVVARIDSKGSFIQNTGSLVPPGAVMAFATENPPAGWLHCNGAAVSRTDYADLFAAIGTMYGSGDGSSTFNLPDYRGQFLRSWDNSSGNDPDSANRADRGDGITGDVVGSKQLDAFKSHTHTDWPEVYAYVAGGGGYPYLYGHYHWGSVNGRALGYTGEAETRPRNISVLYGIKY